MPDTVYIPKGGMCISCKNRLEDCSSLPFDKFPPIDRFKEGDTQYIEVKCLKQEVMKREKSSTIR